MEQKGKVYLIGAGPGDPGLLTLKGRDCLAACDVVVYDRLADPRILSWVNPEAERIYVGKASSNHVMKQEDISKLLVKLAAEGKTVARLKGGDSFVFGRGGEEALLLKENNLPFEFVPGITSANGVDLFFDRLLQNGKDARAFAHNKIAAIGTATADMLTAYGLTADLIPASYKAEDLVDTLLPQLHKGSKVLLARAKEARNVLPDSLRAAGADVDVVAVYQTVSDCENKEELLDALKNKAVDCITFTSSSTVTNLLKALDSEKELLKGVTLAAIGPITAKTMEKNGLKPTVCADTYTIDGLVEALNAFYAVK